MANRPMTIEQISANFKKEMTSLKTDNELKFDSMAALFQSQLQLILGNQTSFLGQLQNEIKSNEKQTRLELRNLIEEVAEFKASLTYNQQISALQRDISKVVSVQGDVSPLTSASEVSLAKTGMCIHFNFVHFTHEHQLTAVGEISSNTLYKQVSETYDETDILWAKTLLELDPSFESIIRNKDLLIEYLTDERTYDDILFSCLDNFRFKL
jgi:hypothetical protein